jgi:hypothetical protein
MPARSQASPAEDQAAVAAIENDHDQLARGLWERTEWLLRSAEDHLLTEAEQDRQDLLTYLRQELVPHIRAARAAAGIAALFAAHLAKENGLLRPALAASPEVSLAALLEHMHGCDVMADGG